ncbi:hypothetical protein K461DRAFT_286153 [Myriangium duriaei CBS 260.36]|uniref:Major facilitator superfamily (MFS) profile domain-containing protein n=1 Tax=Myriangium duriaei CBS 260.36 TaxID=1168546 RepID=A0A9P4J2E4_9PEZI|nr:hypothetical protein K461DRAFT_286153 [Myriangium duriaei CBS 260.36]
MSALGQGNIDEPLLRLSPLELESVVKVFAKDTKLDAHLDILMKGAKLARNRGNFSLVPGLTAAEIDLLEEQEKSTSFLQQTKELQLTIVACAVAAVVQGWDQASINAANLRWPEDLGLATGLDQGHSHDIWLFAFVNAAPFLFASIVGAWLSDPLNEHLVGRRPAILAAAIFCFISVIGSACVKTVWQLLACRILLGIGMGAKASTVPIFAAEASPARIRGSLVMNWQLFVAFGILLGWSINLAVFEIRPLNWRLQLAAAALPALTLLCLIPTCPESPRFLIKKEKWREAYRSLCYLNRSSIVAAKELFLIHVQIQAESKIYGMTDRGLGGDTTDVAADDESYAASFTENTNLYRKQGATTYLKRFVQLFTIPRIRRGTMAAFVVMISQQLCGVNVLAFYSSTIISRDVKHSDPDAEKYHTWTAALWLSWAIGLTNFLFAWPAYLTIDKWGRRALLLLTTPALALSLLGAAFCFKVPNNSSQQVAVAIFMILFFVFYSSGLGPVPFAYSAEVFPLVNREVGMSFSVSCNLLGAGILSLFVPFLNSKMTSIGLLCLFAGLNIPAFVLIYVFVYETKESSLEELNSTFSVPLAWHIRYQRKVMLPWMLSRMRGKNKGDIAIPLNEWFKEQQESLRSRRDKQHRG